MSDPPAGHGPGASYVLARYHPAGHHQARWGAAVELVGTVFIAGAVVVMRTPWRSW